MQKMYWQSVFVCFFLWMSCVAVPSLWASYTTVYSINTNGGLSYTGNTLGLNKRSNQNNPGTSGSIGAFSSLDPSLQVGSFPLGTTLDYTQNGSNAVLDLPTGSTVLHAELIWSGSYGFDPDVTNDDNLAHSATTNATIFLRTPVGGPFTISPQLAKSRVNAGSNGFYVRSADVTSYVQAAGAGTYSVEGVPGTVISSENNLNCAGWTLAVAYAHPNMLTSNLTLFVGCEASGADPAIVTGFHAPDVGQIYGQMFVSALEGDAQISGDQFFVGATTPLVSPEDQISGSNNPANNFFGSQINTLLTLTLDGSIGKLLPNGDAVLDTRGTFGGLNSSSSTATAVSGARQGYDITSIGIGSLIQNGQETMYTQGTTTGDVYTINGLGLQLQVKAPLIKMVKSANLSQAQVGDVVTFTVDVQNLGELEAISLLFTDPLPTGMELVPNSFSVDGTPMANPDLVAGVPLAHLAVGASVQIVFQAKVISPTQGSYSNVATVGYSFIAQGTNPPPNVFISASSNAVTIQGNFSAAPIAVDDTGITQADAVFHGSSVLTNDTGVGVLIQNYQNPSTQGGIVFMMPNGSYSYTPPSGFSGFDTFTYTLVDGNQQTATATVHITVLPLAFNDVGTIASNTLLVGSNILTNDVGTHLAAIPLVNSASAEGGVVNLQANGNYTYLSAPNFSGLDSFSYTVQDASGQTATANVMITVLPVARNDVGQTAANTSLNGSTVFSNDSGSGLAIIGYDTHSYQGGVVSMNPLTGTYIYTPTQNFSGIDTFTYTVRDRLGDTSTATVTITVLPVAVSDTANGFANTPLAGTSVLINDYGSGLTAQPVLGPTIQGGTVTMYPNGTYLYQPPAHFSGVDSYPYVMQDGSFQTASAAVVLTILPSVGNVSESTQVNTLLHGISVLQNSFGIGLHIVTFSPTSKGGGTVSMQPDGSYLYLPPTNFSGSDSFSFTVQDAAGNTGSGTASILVLPKGVEDFFQTPFETQLHGTSVFVNDLGIGLNIVSYETPTSRGGVVGMQPDGTFVYTPPANFAGTDLFTYMGQDQAGSLFEAVVSITVGHPPIIARPDVGSISNGSLGGTAVSNVLVNDLFDGVGASLANVVLEQVSSSHPNISLDLHTGSVVVAPGTVAGTYYLIYKISDPEDPTNAVTTLVTVQVGSAPIMATADSGSVSSGASGGLAVANVLLNDTLGGIAATVDTTTLSLISSSSPKIVLDLRNGSVHVLPDTPAGTYTLLYQIAEILNPTNVAQAIVTVQVGAAPILARDETGSVANGSTGGQAVANVLHHDLLNGVPATLSSVILSQISSTHSHVTVDPNTGSVLVAPGTPAGTYTLVYQIAEKLNPTNTSQASVIVTVGSAPIEALSDLGILPNGSSGGVAVANVLSNDTLNGVPATLDTVLLSQLSSTSPNISLNPNTGAVLVAPGTAAGTYYLIYQICEKLNPNNCTSDIVTIQVGAAPILAQGDSGFVPVGAIGGVAIPNVLSNDTLNGVVATLSSVQLMEISSSDPRIVLHPVTGAVSVASGTPAGTYHLTYQIAEKLNPTNISQAIVDVVVGASVITAEDDVGSVQNGSSGGVAVQNVLGNDTLNGLPASLSEVTLTQISSDSPNISLDPHSGAVSVAPGTPDGVYRLVYRIAEQLNPTNTNEATVLVSVGMIALQANPDFGRVANGANGGIAVANVLINDTLNGFPVSLQQVNIVQLSSTSPHVSLDPSTGAVSVSPATPAGTYFLLYEIQQKLNPSNVSMNFVTVEVGAPFILARDHLGWIPNGSIGGVAVDNVLFNAVLHEQTPLLQQVILRQVQSSSLDVTLDVQTGKILVAPGTPSGVYTLVYEMQDTLNPTNTSQGTVTVIVADPPEPPTHARVYTVKMHTPNGSEWVDVISWEPPLHGPEPIAYHIYRDATLTHFVGEVCAMDVHSGDYAYRHRLRKKQHSHTYYIVSVDGQGNCSEPVKASRHESSSSSGS